MKPIFIAKIAHEMNRRFCALTGDLSQPAWEQAPEWQLDSAISGVEAHIQNPHMTPADSHEIWLEEKQAAGWTYGPVKDEDKLEHPCMVPYQDLPRVQQAKDAIFSIVVWALSDEPLADTSVTESVDYASSDTSTDALLEETDPELENLNDE